MRLSRYELLTRTRSLLEHGKWHQERLSDAGWAPEDVLGGTSFCVVGAAARVALDAGDPRALQDGEVNSERLAKALGFESYGKAWSWNDHRERRKCDVLARLDQEIAKHRPLLGAALIPGGL